MYSVVLMLALSAGADAPARHGHGGCCGCYGGYSCGCYGGCYGCYGGCYGGWGGCYGCYGGGYYGGMGGGYGGSGTGSRGKQDQIAAPATVVVNVPEDAKLLFDDYATKSAASVRTFQTPALPYGTDYTYTLKAEVMRDGKAVTDTKEIRVRAGQVTRATFDLPAAGVAAR